MQKRNFALILIASALLSGCANQSADKIANQLALDRAEAINSKAPYPNVDQYQIMKAQATNNTVILTILSGEQSVQSPVALLDKTAQQYCQMGETQGWLKQGLQYQLKVINMKGATLADKVVSQSQCATATHPNS